MTHTQAIINIALHRVLPLCKRVNNTGGTTPPVPSLTVGGGGPHVVAVVCVHEFTVCRIVDKNRNVGNEKTAVGERAKEKNIIYNT